MVTSGGGSLHVTPTGTGRAGPRPHLTSNSTEWGEAWRLTSHSVRFDAEWGRRVRRASHLARIRVEWG